MSGGPKGWGNSGNDLRRCSVARSGEWPIVGDSREDRCGTSIGRPPERPVCRCRVGRAGPSVVGAAAHLPVRG